ncbi:YadA-like family protein [Pseudomonas sp. JV241A]|uniref:YadA family autotransporter adhesin n=1 Tax=Pseudomonas sp. JV241A TaxID=2078785 RepID=UPI00100C3FDC|nr:YadA-like family protein [Pseudomonas sp. JV241A]SPO65102.1 exported protein of unknown function [Pseudomonas sp. JV241A]
MSDVQTPSHLRQRHSLQRSSLYLSLLAVLSPLAQADSVSGFGTDNTYGAGAVDPEITSNSGNSAYGFNAGAKVTGKHNTTVGSNAGVNVEGSFNSAVGRNAGSNVVGDNNTYAGNDSGNGVKGRGNTGFGINAGRTVNGTGNSGLGANAGQNITGNFNSGAGNNASNRVNGSFNSANGAFSGWNVTGDTNTATGAHAGKQVNGSSNFAAGFSAGNNVSGDNNIAIGRTSGSKISANDTVAIGTDASATASDAVALGNRASAINHNDVALGASSQTAAAQPTAGAVIDGNAYIYAGSKPASVVSVGAQDAERQISNVAAGRVTGTSTDAINGSQLFATHQAVNLVGSRLNSLGGDIANYFGAGAVYNPFTGNMSAPSYLIQGSNYNNVGDAFKAVNTTLTSLDTRITDLRDKSPVQYSNPQTPTQANPYAPGSGGAGGSSSAGSVNGITPTQDVTLVGNAPGQPVSLHNVQDGVVARDSKDAVNGGQLHQTRQHLHNQGNSVANTLGAGSRYDANTGKVSNPTYTVYGNNTSNVGEAIDKLQTGAPVQYSDAHGVATPDVPSNDVTLSGRNSGPVAVHNVAPGIQGTDAVNVNQLHSAIRGGTQGQFDQIRSDVNNLRKDAMGAAAGAMAMASMPQAYLPGRSMLASGMATTGGEASMAVGLSTLSDNGKWVFKANGSADTRGQMGVGVGAGFHW